MASLTPDPDPVPKPGGPLSRWLGPVLPTPTLRPKIRALTAEAAERWGTTTEVLYGTQDRRKWHLARAWVWDQAWRGGHSLPAIGREFGRDHSTIRHGIAKLRAQQGEPRE